MIFGKLGTFATENGFEYDNAKNPLLITNIQGYNYGMYRPSPMNPSTFASLPAASAIAAAVGGRVVADPNAANWNLLLYGSKFPVSNVYAIQLPGKEPVNAGHICAVLGNDIAYNTEARKSEVICGELLQVPFDPSLAGRLFDAVNVFLRF